MAQPTYRDSGVGPASISFATRVAVQVDFGASANAGVVVQGYVEGGANATNISSITVGGTMSGGTTTGTVGVSGTSNIDGTISGGTALTLETQAGQPTLIGAGTVRAGRAAAVSLTGVQWVQMVCSDGNGKPSVTAVTYDGAASIAAGSAVSVFSSTISQAVSTTTNDVALLLVYSDAGDGTTLTPTGPAAQKVRGAAANTGGRQSFGWDSAGLASSTTIAGTASGSVSQVGTKWALTGSVTAPVITGPSGAAGAGSSSKSVAEGVTAVHTFTADVPVSWSKNGGADEADFTINSSTGELAFAVAPDFESAGDSDTNNTYVVVVRATATVGGATADQTVTVTVTNAIEPPLAPTIGTATAGNASASVAFTPPSNTGRPAISGYTATSSPGGITGPGATSPITVSGLTNGVAYTFTVTATNADGTGPASAASNSVTPSAGGDTTPPTQTGSITIGTVTSSSIQMSWPAGSDNVAVTAYEVSKDGGTNWTVLGNVLTYTFTGLTPSTSYPLRVRAKDAAGNVSTPALAASQSTSAGSGGTAGFDFDTAVGCVFGNVSGSLAGLGRETAGRQINVYAKTVGTDTTVAYATALTLDSNARLPRWAHASLVLGTEYDLFFCPVDGGKPGVRRMVAT